MIEFEIDRDYKGFGVSKDLHRGLLASRDGVPLTEEGMGLCACACRAGGRTYFASMADVKDEDGCFTAHLTFDRIIRQRYFGLEAGWLDRVGAFIIEKIYMKHEAVQDPLLSLCCLARKALFKKEQIIATDPAGEAFVSYKPENQDVHIKIKFQLCKPDSTLYVMNELGGNIFDSCLVDGKTVGLLTGWQALKGDPELYSREYGLSFSVRETYVGPGVSSRRYWGREAKGGICAWAGFESEIRTSGNDFVEYGYTVHFREVK